MGRQFVGSYHCRCISRHGCYTDDSRQKVGLRHQMLNFRLMMVVLLMEILVLTMEMR